MNARNVLIFLLILSALINGVNGFFDARNFQAPTWFLLTSMFLLNITIFYWYRLDSIQRSFKRSIWLNIGVIFISLIAIPSYILLRSERGAWLRPFVRMIGYITLLFVTGIACGIAGEMVGKMVG